MQPVNSQTVVLLYLVGLLEVGHAYYLPGESFPDYCVQRGEQNLDMILFGLDVGAWLSWATTHPLVYFGLELDSRFLPLLLFLALLLEEFSHFFRSRFLGLLSLLLLLVLLLLIFLLFVIKVQSVQTCHKVHLVLLRFCTRCLKLILLLLLLSIVKDVEGIRLFWLWLCWLLFLFLFFLVIK